MAVSDWDAGGEGFADGGFVVVWHSESEADDVWASCKKLGGSAGRLVGASARVW